MKPLCFALAVLAILPTLSRAETAPRTQLVLQAVATPRADAEDAEDALQFAVVRGVNDSFVSVRCAAGWDYSEGEKLARFTIVGTRTYLLSAPIALSTCQQRLAALYDNAGEAPFVLVLGKPANTSGLYTKVSLDKEATRALGE